LLCLGPGVSYDACSDLAGATRYNLNLCQDSRGATIPLDRRCVHDLVGARILKVPVVLLAGR
jgi:hypothetical protein